MFFKIVFKIVSNLFQNSGIIWKCQRIARHPTFFFFSFIFSIYFRFFKQQTYLLHLLITPLFFSRNQRNIFNIMIAKIRVSKTNNYFNFLENLEIFKNFGKNGEKYTPFFQNFLKEIHQMANFGNDAYRGPHQNHLFFAYMDPCIFFSIWDIFFKISKKT